MTLAIALSRQGQECIFLVAETDLKMRAALTAHDLKSLILPPTPKYIEELNFYPSDLHALLIDLQHPANVAAPADLTTFITALMTRGVKILCMDGLFEESFRAAPVSACMQPYIGAETDSPPVADIWIKGAEYALLGDGYAGHKAKVIRAEAQNILLTFGGSDPFCLTAKAMFVLLESGHSQTIRVIIGPYFDQQHKADIAEIASTNPSVFELIESPEAMISHYEWADLGIGSSGLSRYEMAAIGVPALFVSLYRNHLKSSEAFNAAGIAINLGLWSDVKDEAWRTAVRSLSSNAERRQTMSIQAQALIDGNGIHRLVSAIMEIL